MFSKAAKTHVINRSVVSAALVAGILCIGANSAGAAVPVDPAVPNGTCGGVFSPSMTGGKASWTLTCSGGKITISGWVEDTKEDGLCARVTAHYSDGSTQVWKACPYGTRTTIKGTGSGSLIDAYLTVSA